MSHHRRVPSVFDPLLSFIESFQKRHESEIARQGREFNADLLKPVLEQLADTKSRRSQFLLLRGAVARGEEAFREIAKGIPKDTLMSLARRAPKEYLGHATLTLAKLLVRYGARESDLNFSLESNGSHNLHLALTDEDLFSAFQLLAIAISVNRLEGMARWLGKGGKLVARPDGGLLVEMPAEVRRAVEAYERRRPRTSLFSSSGFFVTQPAPEDWSEYRIPILVDLNNSHYVEAPEGSDRWLYFERWPTMIDGGGLASLLRGYDEAIQEDWSVGADHILHFLTALATLIHHSSPRLTSSPHWVIQGQPGDQLEHRISFIFSLACKGFLRQHHENLASSIGRVRTAFAQDSVTGRRLGEEFINAFTVSRRNDNESDSDSHLTTPFLHASSDDYLYIDLLLLPDFLANVLEGAKEWYSSQHGDRFVLDLKRWLDREAPGTVLLAKEPIRLKSGNMSDIDLLVRIPSGLLVVECKAYAKSHQFMIGSPDAVNSRRSRIRGAVRQADRIADAFRMSLREGVAATSDAPRVIAAVCTPSVEFLRPLDEYGMVSETTPRVMTPEELLKLALISSLNPH